MADKRQYVRIEAYLPVIYRRLSEEEYEEAKRRCLERRLARDHAPPSILEEIDEEVLRSPALLDAEGLDPAVARAFQAVDRKLNLLLRLLAEDRLNASDEGFFREVNLSGGGLRLTIPEQLRPGDKVELQITLPFCPPSTLLAVGRVVRVTPAAADAAEPGYETAFEFEEIHEEDREKIIQYVFRRQRQILRSRRARAG